MTPTPRDNEFDRHLAEARHELDRLDPPGPVAPAQEVDTPGWAGRAAATSRSGPPPGWFADPQNPSQPRWWSGTEWGPPTWQPPAVHNTTVVVQQQRKDPAVALLLTFFFGPLGMLYSTVAGGLIMLVIGVVAIPLTLGFAILVLWPIQMVWAYQAAKDSTPSHGQVYRS